MMCAGVNGRKVTHGRTMPFGVDRICGRAIDTSRRQPPIQRSLQNVRPSSCVPYNSESILISVTVAIQPGSAVTSSATRKTETPP